VYFRSIRVGDRRPAGGASGGGGDPRSPGGAARSHHQANRCRRASGSSRSWPPGSRPGRPRSTMAGPVPQDEHSPCAARATRTPRPAEGLRRAAQVCAASGPSRSPCADHAPRVALPGRGPAQTFALCLTERVHCAALLIYHSPRHRRELPLNAAAVPGGSGGSTWWVAERPGSRKPSDSAHAAPSAASRDREQPLRVGPGSSGLVVPRARRPPQLALKDRALASSERAPRTGPRRIRTLRTGARFSQSRSRPSARFACHRPGPPVCEESTDVLLAGRVCRVGNPTDLKLKKIIYCAYFGIR
jgi:hypothetical protein